MYICEYCSGAIKHVEFNEDLKKVLYSHQRDFAIWGKLAEFGNHPKRKPPREGGVPVIKVTLTGPIKKHNVHFFL